jgi:hypothetical protein
MHFKAHKSLKLSLALAASLVLAGCQGGFGTSADSRLNSKTEQYEAQFFGSSGWGACAVGAVGGALVGALAGQVKGKDTETTLKGAAIGAAGGCVTAMGYNYYLEKQRVNNATAEAQINSAINDVKTLNAGISQDIRSAQSVINEDISKLKALNQQIKNKTIEASAARQELAKVDANLKQLKKTRTSMQNQYDEFVKVSKQLQSDGAKTVKTTSLNKEIAQVKKQISQMDSMIASLTSQRTAIQVG